MRFNYIVQLQNYGGWQVIVSCNSFDCSVRIADAVANSEGGMTRVLDVIHDRIIVHERAAPPEFADDNWHDEQEAEQVNWAKDGF